MPAIKEAKQLFNDLKRPGSFAQNTSLLFSSHSAAQILGLLLIPIISRLYTPEMYGTFAIFSSLVLFFSSASMLAYEQALVLPKFRRQFGQLLQLCFLILLFSSLVSVLLFSFGSKLFEVLKIGELSYLVWLIPLTIMLTGVRSILGRWNVRDKQFKQASILAILNSFSGRSFNIGYALALGAGHLGLILGHIFNILAAIVVNWFISIRYRFGQACRPSSIKRLLQVAKKYRNYPCHVLPASWINQFAQHITVIGLAVCFSKEISGAFIFGLQLVNIPITIMANSIAPVFLQKANELRHAHSANFLQDAATKLLKVVIWLSVGPIALLILFGEQIFSVLFGNTWLYAGTMLALLAPSYLFSLGWQVASPSLQVLGKEKILLYANLLLMLGRLVALAFGAQLNSVEAALTLILIFDTSIYSFFIIKLLGLLGAKAFGVSIQLILGPSLIFAVTFALRQLIA